MPGTVATDPGPPTDTAAPRMRHVRELPARSGVSAPWPDWVPAEVRSGCERVGIRRLWRHQAEAAELLRSGRSTVLTTGTASGKSLGYLLPTVTSTSGPVAGTALYIAPTKALAHDQLRSCLAFGWPNWRVATLDGDSEPAERDWARQHAAYVLTNPDMLHRSVLPAHAQWSRLLGSLTLVVVDEAHRYRGVFGAQVAGVLRRLRRLAEHHAARPVFALASATTTDGAELSRALTGLDDVAAVTDDSSARGPVRISFVEPDGWAEDQTATMLAASVRQQRQTIAFVGSRRGAETVALRARGLADGTPAIQAYRGGYLAADRRRIERGLRDRSVLGVAATSALELGVDLTGIDDVLMCGFPGTRASFWQQAGRAGRQGQPARVAVVARTHPLDTYLLDHPDALLSAPVEAPPVNADNRHVLQPHLGAAAQELPITEADERFFGPSTQADLAALAASGAVRRRATGWFWTRPERAVDGIDLRLSSRDVVDIVEEETGRVLGHVEAAAADASVHPGAVYLHQGETYLCDNLDLDVAEALVRRARPGYVTQPRMQVDARVLSVTAARPVGAATVSLGEIEVTSRVTGYLRRDEVTGDVWDSTPLDLPSRSQRVHAVWLSLDAARIAATAEGRAVLDRIDPGLHALEHVLVALLPVFASCDHRDLGAFSAGDHPDTGAPTIFVHEQHPGGLGFVERGSLAAEEWFVAAAERLVSCGCETGCPACILSAQCRTPARALDKSVAGTLAHMLVGDRPSST